MAVVLTAAAVLVAGAPALPVQAQAVETSKAAADSSGKAPSPARKGEPMPEPKSEAGAYTAPAVSEPARAAGPAAGPDGQAAARAAGEPGVRPGDETTSPFVRQVRQADGSVRATFYNQPAFGVGEDGKRRQSDNKLSDTPDSTEDAAEAKNAFKPLKFGRKANKLVEIELPQGSIRIGSKELKLGKPEKAADGTLLYRDVALDTDLRMAPAGAGVRTELVLKSAKAPTSFVFDLADPKGQLGDGKVTEAGGFRFSSPVDDGVQLEFGAPYAYEVDTARPGYIDGGEAGSATLKAVPVNGGWTLTKTISPQWLAGKSWPIVLDPQVQYTAATAPVVDCTIINNELAATNMCGSTNMEVGYGSGTGTGGALRRMLLFFGANDRGVNGTPPANITPGSTIDKATLQLTLLNNFQQNSTTTLSAYQQPATWFDTATWNSSRVVTNATTGAKTLTPWSNGAGSTTMPAGAKQPSGPAVPLAAGSLYNLDVTAAARSWAAGASYMGLQVRMDNEATTPTRVFGFGSRFGASTQFPKYIVDYTPPTTPLIAKTSAPATSALDDATPGLTGAGAGSPATGASPQTYGRGQAVVYTVRITNPAAVAQNGLKVSDPLNPALKIKPGSLLGCPAAPTVCQLNQAGPGLQVSNLSLPAGGSTTLRYTAIVDNLDDRACKSIANTATVTTVDNTSNTSTDTVLVCDQALGLEPWWSYAARTTTGPQGNAQVNVSSGNLVAQQVDSTPVQAHGRLSYVLRRTYNSQDATVATLPGSLGAGWLLSLGEAGDALGAGLSPTGLSVPRLANPANPLPLVLADRDGTRHTFTPKSSNLNLQVMRKDSSNQLVSIPTVLGSLLPQNLTAAVDLAKYNSVCLDTSYTSPPGVHLSVWRYIALNNTGASGACATTASQAAPVALGYVAIRPDRLRSEFSWDGRLLSMIDPAGVEMRYQYGTSLPAAGIEAGPLKLVYEPIGACKPTSNGELPASCRAFRFAYSTPAPGATTETTTVTDPAGRNTEYTFDRPTTGPKHLLSVTNPAGQGTLRYTYSGINYTGPGGETTCGQATVGQLCTATDPRGTVTAFRYSPAPSGPARISTVTDRRGTTTTLAYSAGTGSVLPATTATRGGSRISAYKKIDTFGRVGLVEDADTAGTLYRRTAYTWDSGNTPATSCRKPDNRFDHNLCATERRASLAKDPASPPSPQFDLASDADQVTRNTYNDQGNVLTEERSNPAGGVDRTSYGYAVQSITSSGSGSTVNDVVRAGGLVASATRPASSGVLYTLSDRTAMLPPRGGQAGGDPTLPCASRQPCASFLTITVPDALDSKTANRTDPLALPCTDGGAPTGNTGLVCEVRGPVFTGGTTAPESSLARSITRYRYDRSGQRTHWTTPLAVLEAQQTGAPAKSYRYDYIDDGTTDLSGLTDAGGWLRGVTDPDGKFVAFAHDRAGNTVRTWDRNATTNATGTTPANYSGPNSLANPPSRQYSQTLYGMPAAALPTDGTATEQDVQPALANPWRYVRSTRDALGNTSSTCVDVNGNAQLSRPGRGSDGKIVTDCSAALSGPGEYDSLATYSSDDLPLTVLAPEQAQRNGNNADAPARTTYNAFAEPTVVTDPRGIPAVTAYDNAGRPTSRSWTRDSAPTNPDGTRRSAPEQCRPGTVTTSADAPLAAQRIKCTSTTGYDSFDQVTGQSDANGATTTWTYDRLGRKSSQLVPRGSDSGFATLRTEWLYDADSHVTTVCPPRQFATDNGAARPGGCTSTATFSTHTSYDPAGRPATMTRYRQAPAGGSTTALVASMAYDADGNTISTTDPNASALASGSYATTTNFDLLGRPTDVTVPRGTSQANTTRYGYDPVGNTTLIQAPAVDGPRNTVSRYDALNRQVETVQGTTATTVATAGPTDAAGGTNIRTRVFFDADGNTIGALDPRAFAGTSSVLTSTDNRYLSRTDYDLNGRPVASYTPRSDTDTRQPATSPDDCRTTTRPASVKRSSAMQQADPLPDYPGDVAVCVTRTRYDDANRPIRSTAPTAANDPQRYTTTRYTDDGLPAAMLNPAPTGAGTGDSTEPTDSGGTREVVTTSMTYDGAGRTIATVDPLSRTSSSVFHNDGTLASSTDPMGRTTRYRYDADGNTLVTTNPRGETTTTAYNSDGTTASSADGLGRTTRYSYDPNGNPTAVTSPSAADPTNAASNNPSGTPTTSTYTRDNLLLSTTAPIAADGSLRRRTDYGYDAASRRTTTRTYEVQADGTGGLTEKQDRDGGTTRLSYYRNDRLETETGRDGQTITTRYDAAGNKLTIDDSTTGGSTITATYYLDGLPRTVADRAGSAGTTTSGAALPAPERRTSTYGYDGTGATTTRSDAKNDEPAVTTNYTYDRAGLPVRLSGAELAGNGTATWFYDAAGRPRTSVLPNMTTMSWEYYDDDELREQTLTSTSSAISTASRGQFGKWTYARDELGRVTQAGHTGRAALDALGSSNSPVDGTQSYTYDAAGQLSSYTQAGFTPAATASQPGGDTTGNNTTKTITHDLNGNRTKYGDATYSYNADDTIKSSRTKPDQPLLTHSYTAFGAVANDGCNAYTYDGFDRTSKIIGRDTTPEELAGTVRPCPTARTSSFAYDGLDRQRSHANSTKIGEGSSTVAADVPVVVHYDGFGQTITSQSAAGTADLRYTLTATGDPFAISTIGTGALAEQLVDDGNGNITGTTNSTGLIACAQRFDAYGSPLKASSGDNACATGTTRNDVSWAAGRRDSGTGTYQFGSRTYSPDRAGFLSPDTFRNTDTTANQGLGVDPLTRNSYNYVNGDPLNFVDPNGHWPRWRCKWCGKAGRIFAKTAFVAGAAVGATAVCIGSGGIACGAAIGAAVDSSTAAIKCGSDSGACLKSIAIGIGRGAATGAVGGAITGKLLAGASKAAAPLARKAAEKLGARTTGALRGSATGSVSGATDSTVTQLATTGRVDGSSLALAAGAGGLLGGLGGGLAARGTSAAQEAGPIHWVDEGGNLRAGGNRGMKDDAYDYQSGTYGARSNAVTGYSMAPQLRMPAADGTVFTSKFDGVEGLNMIDRKLSVVPLARTVDEARRQAATAAYNGYGVIWELPTEKAAAAAQRFLTAKAGVSSISVRVAP